MELLLMLTTHSVGDKEPVQPAMMVLTMVHIQSRQVRPMCMPQQQQGPDKLQSMRQRTEHIFVPEFMARNMFPGTLRQSVTMMSGVLEQNLQGQMLSFARPAGQEGRSCST